MAVTLTELQEKLKKIDEVSLMEVLEITSEDMVQRFIDRIEERFDELVTEFEDPDDDSPDFYIPWVDEEEIELGEEDYDE
jgi:hypothetical protein